MIVVAVEPVGFVFFGDGWWEITGLALTPALSRGERESGRSVVGRNGVRGFCDSLWNRGAGTA